MPARTSTTSREAIRWPGSPCAIPPLICTGPFRALAYRSHEMSGDCLARLANPSCLRGQSIRPRPVCRWIELQQRMRIPFRGNKPRRIRLLGLSRCFRSPRVTDLRCGASKSKSSLERDASNLLLLRGIVRFLTVQAGAPSLSAIDACGPGASVDDAPIYAPDSAIASVRIRTDSRLARRSKRRNGGPSARPSPT